MGIEPREGGSRWAALPHKEWPEDEEQQKVILSDFDLSSKYGDRRQEIVFIGANMDEVSGVVRLYWSKHGWGKWKGFSCVFRVFWSMLVLASGPARHRTSSNWRMVRLNRVTGGGGAFLERHKQSIVVW